MADAKLMTPRTCIMTPDKADNEALVWGSLRETLPNVTVQSD